MMCDSSTLSHWSMMSDEFWRSWIAATLEAVIVFPFDFTSVMESVENEQCVISSCDAPAQYSPNP
jgi:hypothetical protein